MMTPKLYVLHLQSGIAGISSSGVLTLKAVALSKPFSQWKTAPASLTLSDAGGDCPPQDFLSHN